jgi:uncharacterized protein (DUF1015 family)
MDSEEARQITDKNRDSFLRVTKAEVDLAPNIDTHAPAVYEQAAKTLAEFIDSKRLIQDQENCFYIYKQKMGEHVQIGLVAAASVDEYKQGIIKKHELTRPDKEQDRVDHITATKAQTGAVFLTYKAKPEVNALVEECMKKAPTYDFITEDGIAHTLYVVNDKQQVAAIEQAFRNIDVMYIADGHHRSAAAMRVAEAMRQQKSDYTGAEEFNRFLAVIFPHDMMYIMDYNRVVKDLQGLTKEDFLAKVSEKFTVCEAPAGVKRPNATHTFGMYLGNKWYQLSAKQGTFADDPVASLDASILQNNLLAPLLGIKDPRTDQRISFVGGIRGMEELERLVDSGKFAVAFSMFATSIEELMAIADAGEIMPPKSTWFEPKLRDAMVVHLL